MHRFAALYERLDRTTSTNEKVEALKEYFRITPAEDAAWGLYFLAGEKIKRLVPTKRLKLWCMERAGVADWLFSASHQHVGDLAETITLLIDAHRREQEPLEPDRLGLRAWVEDRLLTLRGLSEEEQREKVLAWWDGLPRSELFLFVKMLTGELRIGVTRTLVERALSELAGVEQSVVSHRLMGAWRPTPAFLERVLSHDQGHDAGGEPGRPYPFFLASPVLPPDLPDDFAGDETEWVARELGDPADWLADWKWDGIRAQIIKRQGEVFLWSRGDENLTERFPEVVEAAARLRDGTVLDGELLCWMPGETAPMGFGVLQRRIGRKQLGPNVLREAPAALVAYDALEHEGRDAREEPIERRLEMLEQSLGPAEQRSETIKLFEPFAFESWEALAGLRAESRKRGVEGVMLKRKGSPYRAGRRRGDWWKWKIEPLTIDAVLVYAEPGHGRRANLLTDYTFAVWEGEPARGGELITVTKAYSGLSDEEFAELDRWIRTHTVDRYGPVRAVEPMQVFELAFEGVRRSTRHKSGVALRFPRMKRWRKDKPAAEADTIESVWSMIGSDDESG